MYNTYLVAVFLILLAGLLVHYRPKNIEGFASVNPLLMPECVSRSTDAQSLLVRLPASGEDADELRQLVSKVCCMEADIAAPSAGVYRTMHAQFRTSQDMEPPATIVGRCLRNAVNKRDIDLIVEKYAQRGRALIRKICMGSDLNLALGEWDGVITRLQLAMFSFCLKEQPVMDRPLGVRDMGFWEPETVADLSQYQGVSAVPK